jgi:hypothetical protein
MAAMSGFLGALRRMMQEGVNSRPGLWKGLLIRLVQDWQLRTWLLKLP